MTQVILKEKCRSWKVTTLIKLPFEVDLEKKDQKYTYKAKIQGPQSVLKGFLNYQKMYYLQIIKCKKNKKIFLSSVPVSRQIAQMQCLLYVYLFFGALAATDVQYSGLARSPPDSSSPRNNSSSNNSSITPE